MVAAFCLIDDSDRLLQGSLILLGAVHARLLEKDWALGCVDALALHVRCSLHPHETVVYLRRHFALLLETFRADA